MAASMAAVMAVSSAIVCQISASAAETDITSQITIGISVSELSQYKRVAAVCAYRFEIFVQTATAFGNAALFKEFPEILP